MTVKASHSVPRGADSQVGSASASGNSLLPRGYARASVNFVGGRSLPAWMLAVRESGIPFRLSLWAVAGLCLFSLCARADQALSDGQRGLLEERGEIVFVSQTEYPPFEFIDERGERQGMCIDLVRWMATQFGFRARFVDMPFAEAQAAVLSGEADVLTSLFFSDDRDERFDFTRTMFEVPASIFVRTERPDIIGIEDLEGLRIAMQRGDYAQEFLAEAGISFDLVPTATFAEAADLVIAGEADAVIGDEQIVLYHLFSNSLTDQMKTVGEPLYVGLNCMAVREGQAELLAILNEGLGVARSTGVVDNISRKWLGRQLAPDSSLVDHLTHILIALGVLAALALIVILWNFQLRHLIEWRTQELRASEEQNRAILAAIPDLMFRQRRDGTYLDYRSVAESALAVPSDSIIGHNIRDMALPQEFIDQTLRAVTTALDTGKLMGFEYQLEVAQGLREFEARIVPCGEDEVLCIVRDITERRRAERDLRHSEERHRKVVALAEAVAYEQDLPSHEFTFWGEGVERVTGYTAEELTVETWRGILEETVLRGALTGLSQEEIRRRCESGELLEWQADFRIRTRTGEERWLADSSVHILDEQGRPMRAIGILQDITERKRAEEALRAHNERLALQNAVAKATTGSLTLESLCDQLLEIVRAAMPCDAMLVAIRDENSDEMRSVRGYDMIDGDLKPVVIGQTTLVPGDPIYDAIIDGTRPLLVHRADPEGESPRERRFGDSLRPSASLLCAPLVRGNQTVGVISAQSYTPQAFTERHVEILSLVAQQAGAAVEAAVLGRQLRESEERFRTLAENIPGVIYLCRNDERYTMLYLSDEVETLTGCPKEEFLSDRVSFVDLYHPEDAAGVVEDVDRALAAHLPFHVTYRLRHSSGEWRWVEEWGTGLYRDGQLHLLEGFLADITERKSAEEERLHLEAQVQHAQKLESLGVLAGGIAHDFNNLLVAMMGNAGLALMDLPPESPVRETIRQIEIAAQRAAELTNQLLAYSGKGKFIIETIDLSVLVHEMLHLLEATISKKTQLKCDLVRDLPAVEADATQIRQVVMNMITNASEALEGRSGVITLRTGTVITEEEDLRSTYFNGEMPEGEGVFLEVVDTGTGMDRETLESIFDPFFTTKFTGRGLGLAAVLGIVRGHGGALIVDSEINRGTTFRVILPRAPAGASSVKREVGELRGADPDWRGVGTVLIVDDEQGVRDLARRVCERRGFEVLCAVDGQDAIDAFNTHCDDISLVLLDMTMPHMDGVEVFDEMHRLRPEIPVILSSGFSEQEAVDRFGQRGLAGFIQKPYRPQALLDKIRGALGV
jgi:PAS domain S-box-containing protein